MTNKGVFSALTNPKLDVGKLFGNVEKYKHKDLAPFIPIIDWFSKEEGKELMRVLISQLILPLYEMGLDLDRRLTDEAMEGFMKAVKSSPSPIPELFKVFLMLRALVKGREEDKKAVAEIMKGLIKGEEG